MAQFTTQADVDAAFADLDDLLAASQPPPVVGCTNCGGCVFDRGSNGGTVDYFNVCRDCGVVSSANYGMSRTQMPVRAPVSNYKRIHHWHERISQLLLSDQQVSRAALLSQCGSSDRDRV